MTATTAYLATFDRIGRNHDVAPLAVTGDADAIAEQVWRYARTRLGSRDVEVSIDLEARAGRIFAGMRNAGSLTLSAVPS
jgi:hypothetical protein